MTEHGDSSAFGVALDDVTLDEGGVRIAGGTFHVGKSGEAIPLTDIVSAEETSAPKSASQILTIVLGCLVLLVAVPSAMMCPLALMGIPVGAKVLSKALHDQESAFALRVGVRGRRAIVVRFDQRRHGARVEEALLRVIDARSR